MRKLIVVHLPVKIKNPTAETIPAEDIADYLSGGKPLRFNISHKTQLIGSAVPPQHYERDFIVDDQMNVVGKVSQTLAFQNIAPLELPPSIYSIVQPLHETIRPMWTYRSHKQVSSTNQNWVCAPGKVLTAIETYVPNPTLKALFDRRPVMSSHVVRALAPGMTAFQQQSHLRRLCYQWSSGPFSNVWIRRGYQPHTLGYAAVGCRLELAQVTEVCQLFKRLRPEALAAIKLRFPHQLQQFELIYKQKEQKIALMSIQVCDFSCLEGVEAADGSLAQKLEHLRRIVRSRAADFINNAAQIMAGIGGRDDINLVKVGDQLLEPVTGQEIEVFTEALQVEEAEEEEESENEATDTE